MTEREKTDIEFNNLLAQFDKTLSMIKSFNNKLQSQCDELLIEIAEQIANKKQ